MTALALVAAVDAGFAHSRAVRSLSAAQRRTARLIACRCDAACVSCRCGAPIRLMARRGRWPRRYVVTAAGSHLLRSFLMTSDWFRVEVARASYDARKGKVAS